MQERISSKTLIDLRNIFCLESLENDSHSLALFCQIFHWLKTANSKMNEYSNYSKVAQRRDSMNLHLFKKSSENNQNEFQILKDFPINHMGNMISCFVRDTVIPLLIASPFVLEFSDIFYDDKVIFFGLFRDTFC